MPSKLRREVSDARRRPKRRQDPSSSSSQRPRQQRAPPSIPETVRGGSAQNRSRPAMAKRSKQSSAAAAAAARRVRAARSNQKENSRPPQRAVKGQVGWGDPRKKTERKKPYGDSGVSDATRKYREKKAAGSNLDMDSASAVYKARMRAKKSRRKKGALPSYVDSVDPNSLAAKAAKAKQAAKGKAAFGSGAGSVADDLNEHVFGKGKVKRQMYTADGKTKQLAGASVKAKLKGKQRGGSSSSSAGAGASRRSSPRTQGASPRQPAANPVSMGSNGRKLGGSRIKSQTTDPRELRLRALAARGLA